MREIAWLIAKCLLFAGGVALAVMTVVWFETSRPAPEHKPGSTVLEIGE